MHYNQPSYLGLSMKVKYLDSILVSTNFNGGMCHCS